MNKDTWDLKKIFKTKEEYYDEIKQLEIDIVKFSKSKDFINKGKSLLVILEKFYDLQRRLDKVYVYAKLKSDANGLDEEANAQLIRATNLYQFADTKTTFVSNELKKLSKKKIQVLLKEEPSLKAYNFMFKRLLNNKKHLLSLKEEELLSKSSIIRNSFDTIFSKIDAVDVSFDKVNKQELNHSNYILFLKNKNFLIRKKAFKRYHEYYKKHANSIGTCLLNSLRNDCFEANVRRYKNALCMSMHGDDINDQVYYDLIKTINNNLPLFHQYLDLKTKANKLTKCHMYDLYLDSANYNKQFSFEEAKKIVSDSIKILGDDYSSNFEKAFDQCWIDKYYRKGKYSGAYSSGSYDTYPYLLLNYNNSFRSIETLAHEMGHSMHSYYTNNNNPYHLSHYPIFLAEIASNVGEILLFNHILNNSDDPEEKKYILETILESFKGSIFRQTQFAEYEEILHKKIENNEPLTTENMINIYYELNKKYYGNKIISDDLIRYEALRIPHFYSSFYVYKYATGLALAYIFANRILNKEKDAIENYLKFLKIGGTDYPLNVLKECNVIMNSKTINESMKIFKKYLSEYKNLIEGEQNGK